MPFFFSFGHQRNKIQLTFKCSPCDNISVTIEEQYFYCENLQEHVCSDVCNFSDFLLNFSRGESFSLWSCSARSSTFVVCCSFWEEAISPGDNATQLLSKLLGLQAWMLDLSFFFSWPPGIATSTFPRPVAFLKETPNFVRLLRGKLFYLNRREEIFSEKENIEVELNLKESFFLYFAFDLQKFWSLLWIFLLRLPNFHSHYCILDISTFRFIYLLFWINFSQEFCRSTARYRLTVTKNVSVINRAFQKCSDYVIFFSKQSRGACHQEAFWSNWCRNAVEKN